MCLVGGNHFSFLLQPKCATEVSEPIEASFLTTLCELGPIAKMGPCIRHMNGKGLWARYEFGGSCPSHIATCLTICGAPRSLYSAAMMSYTASQERQRQGPSTVIGGTLQSLSSDLHITCAWSQPTRLPLPVQQTSQC